MHKTVISILCGTMVFLQSCRTLSNQTISENINGRFKVVVRTQEFNHSGTEIVDVCVANTVSHEFPHTETSQCFLRGFDFDGLSVKWHGASVIEVLFRSGRVTRFKNTALAYPGGPVPEEFHTFLCDGCDPVGGPPFPTLLLPHTIPRVPQASCGSAASATARTSSAATTIGCR